MNNITGALQSQNVNTLNGEILTQRTITADKIVANAITASEIAAKTITANQLASNSVTTDKIAVNAVTADKIDVNNLFAQTITATGKITASNMNITGGSIKFNGNKDNSFIDMSYSTTDSAFITHDYNIHIDYAGMEFSDLNDTTGYSAKVVADGLYFNNIKVIDNPGQTFPSICNVGNVETYDGISLRELYSKLVKRKTVIKTISNQSYAVITKSEFNIGEAYIIDVNIARSPSYGYHFVTGHGVDSSGNLFVYFDGSINAEVVIIVHYAIL